MNYLKIYNDLINHAKSRFLSAESYTENHHILPKCMGGTDDVQNLVRLFPEEHFVAHQLLVRIYPGNLKLTSAAILMTIHHTNKRINNKLYGWLRRAHSEAMSNRIVSEETKRKISKSKTGKSPSPEALARIREAAKLRIDSEETRKKKGAAWVGKNHSDETKKKMSITHTGMKRNFSEETLEKFSNRVREMGKKPKSEETRQKMSEAAKGRPKSEEHKEKLRQANLGKKTSEETKLKMSESQKKINRPRGPGGTFLPKE